MKLILLLLLTFNALAATTTHKTDKLKLGRNTGEDIYIFADTGATSLPYLFFDFSEGVWKQSNDGVTSEIIGGASVITTEGDLIVGNGSGENSRLGIGTAGQLLTVSGGTATWQDAPVSTTVSSKGDIQTHDGTSNASLAVGADGSFLVADSTETTGLKWSDTLSGTLTPVTNWDDLNVTLSNTTTSALTAKYRIVGDTLHGYIDATITAVSGSMGFSLDDFTIDNQKLPDNFTNVGTIGGYDEGTAQYTGTVLAKTDDTFALSGGGASNTWDATDPFNWASGDNLRIEFEVPVEGKSSGTDAVARNKKIIKAKFGSNVDQAVSNNTSTTISLATSKYDDQSIVDFANNKIVIPEDGVYTLNPNIILRNTTSTQPANNSRCFSGYTVIAGPNNGQTGTIGFFRLGQPTNTLWSYPCGVQTYEGEFSEGDEIQFLIEHNFGSNVELVANDYIALTQKPENSVIAGTFGKCQTKFLSADITSSVADVADLKFENLEIGQRYVISMHNFLEVGSSSAFNAGYNVCNSQYRIGDNPTNTLIEGNQKECRFTATATSITYATANLSADRILRGNNNTFETFATLCTDISKPTTEW